MTAYSRLDRPPLHAGSLRRALVVPDGLWTAVEVRAETGSTNADVARAARAGAAEGLIVVAESQTAGRGRLDRRWVSPARAGLACSVLLRPGPAIPMRWYGWLPLLSGVALVETVRRLSELDALLKWPNDLLIDGLKCAGILAETVPGPGGKAGPGDKAGPGVGPATTAGPGPGAGPGNGAGAVVIGIGLNVTTDAEELPPGVPATSLRLSGSACTDRDPLLRALLRGLADWYQRWRTADGDPDECGLRDAYRIYCATLGAAVTVRLPDGGSLTGQASDVDHDGRLVVTEGDGSSTAVPAGDVVHVR